jgi:probable F420-dependent oxidoreductase
VSVVIAPCWSTNRPADPPGGLPTIDLVTARPFRFALQMMALDDPEQVAQAAADAERLGYEELYSYDHLGTVDPFVPMMVAAAAATTVGVGPLVLNNEFHHPALLARTAATVDRMIGGRLILGIGTGYMQSEHDAMALPLLPPGPRVRRLGESLEVLRSLLDSGTATFDGEFHHIAVESLGIRPAREHVPFLIGGNGRRVVALAARFADIFQFTGLVHGEGGVPTPGGFALDHIRQRAEWLAVDAGDRLAAIERSALVQMMHLGPGADEAMAPIIERFGSTPELVAETPFMFYGSVEQVIDKIERLREDVGITHYVVRDAEQFAPVAAALAGK